MLEDAIYKSPNLHDDVIKWKHFPRYWLFVRGIHRSHNSPNKGQWRRALVFSLICALNKRLSKQWRGWWFETPSCPLWCHCNVNVPSSLNMSMTILWMTFNKSVSKFRMMPGHCKNVRRTSYNICKMLTINTRQLACEWKICGAVLF